MAFRLRVLLVLAAVGSFAAGGCSGGPSATHTEARKHAADLRPVLVQYDREIAALQSTINTPYFEDSTAQINRAIESLRGELEASASQIDTLVAQKAAQYQAREDNAVAALLATAQSSAPNQSEIAARLQQTYRNQYAELRSSADRDMAAYQNAVTAQQKSAFDAFVASVTNRTQRAFAARAQELREQEATLALDLARRDAPTLLPLRTKLRTLTLDSEARANLEGRIAQIEAAENATLNRRKSADAGTLRAYQAQLTASAKRDIGRMAAELQTRTMANLSARRDVLVAQRAMAGRPLPVSDAPPCCETNTNLRAQVAALRAADRGRFQRDANATIASYTAARNDLTTRFAAIRDQDAAARQNALATIAQLRRERAALAAQLH